VQILVTIVPKRPVGFRTCEGNSQLTLDVVGQLPVVEVAGDDKSIICDVDSGVSR